MVDAQAAGRAHGRADHRNPRGVACGAQPVRREAGDRPVLPQRPQRIRRRDLALEGEVAQETDRLRIAWLRPADGSVEFAELHRVIYRPAGRSFRDRAYDRHEVAIVMAHPAPRWLLAWTGRAPAPPLGPLT